MDAPYRTSHLMKWFGVSQETIRRWAIEFERHLDNGAKPQKKGAVRKFTEIDARKLALVAEMSRDYAPFDEIHASLDNASLEYLPEIEDFLLNEQIQEAGNVELRAALQQLTAAKEQVEQLQRERDEFKSRLEEAERDAMLARLYKEQYETAQAQIAQLNREIGRLENEVKRGDPE